MAPEIYYFSGTGNSLAVARDIARKLEAQLYAIASLLGEDRIPLDAEVVGIVFPVYHKSIPLIIKRFAEKLEGLQETYLFAVYTYGDTSGLAAEHLDALLQARGAKLAAGFGVHMPYNYLTPAPKLRGFFDAFTLREVPVGKQEALLANAPERIEAIVEAVQAQESGVLDMTADPLTRLADRFGLAETLGKAVWLKVAGVDAPPDVPFIESRQWMDEGFQVDATCISCGVCAQICPVDNIRMLKGRPTWRHRCEQCFACLQWCPEEAIQFGSETSGKRRYHHPDVTLADMRRAASKEEGHG